MNADLLFSNVEFFGAPSGQRVRVKRGETFTVNLKETEGTVVWAHTEDPVLSVAHGQNTAEIKALTVGPAELQIQRNRQVIFYIAIDVYDPAVSVALNASTSEPRQRPA